MKQRYGHQGCYLLKVNSRSSSAEDDEQMPDPWSQYLHRSNMQNQVSAALIVGLIVCGVLWNNGPCVVMGTRCRRMKMQL